MEEESNRIMTIIEDRDNLILNLKEELMSKENECMVYKKRLISSGVQP